MFMIFRYICVLAALFAVSTAARAKVSINVDLSSQRMHVTSDSGESHSWAISSGRPGYRTPRGVFHPTSLQAMHRSRQYDDSPMPHSIFFDGGYAIHGTFETRGLGRPVSHGCVRIAPSAAAKLFAMVRAEGASITIRGQAPGGRAHRRRASGFVSGDRESSSPDAYWQENFDRY